MTYNNYKTYKLWHNLLFNSAPKIGKMVPSQLKNLKPVKTFKFAITRRLLQICPL